MSGLEVIVTLLPLRCLNSLYNYEKKKKGTNHESQLEVWQNGRFISMKYLLSEKQNFQTESRPLKKHSPIFKTLQLAWHFDNAISRDVNEIEEH